MARPKIEIDKKQFESACGIQCTLSEIAAFFDCSEDTVERWCKRTYGEGFADIYKKKSEKGKISLRRNQLKLSETNASMAIWLVSSGLDKEKRLFILKVTTETIGLLWRLKIVQKRRKNK